MQLFIRDADGGLRDHHAGAQDVARAAAPLGVQVGHIGVATAAGNSLPAVADAGALAALHRRFGIRSADRVRIAPGEARWPALRRQFRQRHTHAQHEVRVFLHGQGLFELALADGGLAQLLVQAGDWVALPPDAAHAFDAGRAARFDALRLFASDQGRLSTPAADAATAPLPDLDRLLAELAELQTAPA